MLLTQIASVWGYGAEEFVHGFCNLSCASVTWLNTSAEGADAPMVNKWGGKNKLFSKATTVCWHTKALFLQDTSLCACKCNLPPASGNKQNKCCSSENTDILHHSDILLTASLLPEVLSPAFSQLQSFFKTPFLHAITLQKIRCFFLSTHLSKSSTASSSAAMSISKYLTFLLQGHSQKSNPNGVKVWIYCWLRKVHVPIQN